MKKSACILAMFALVLLAGGCTLPPVHNQNPRPDKEPSASKSSQPEKPSASAARPETKGKRVSLIPQDKTAQAPQATPPEKTPAPAQEIPPVPPPPQPQTQALPPPPPGQVFTDYDTGLTFTYQRPWHLVSTQGDGPILGRDGHSQLTVRFTTLTTDKDKGAQKGYFYAPEESIAAAIGKTVQAMLGAGDKRATRGKTPLDVLLTQKYFPNLIIQKRYRGNAGGIIVQECRHKQLPGLIQVYHIFSGDKVASFSLSELKNRQLKLEMQQIVLSTKKP